MVEKDYRIVFWYKIYKFVQKILSYLYSIFIITPRTNLIVSVKVFKKRQQSPFR